MVNENINRQLSAAKRQGIGEA
jgi:hypothetical protein